jgi:hypothetical protein
MEDILTEIDGNFVDIFIPSNVLGKYNINKFMDFLDGHAKKLEPRIYDEENPIETDDDVQSSDFTGEINLMNIAADFINSLSYDEDLKERLIKSVSDLYKQTLTPTYED